VSSRDNPRSVFAFDRRLCQNRLTFSIPTLAAVDVDGGLVQEIDTRKPQNCGVVQAKAGELLFSAATRTVAGLPTNGLETRHLSLKGRQEPIEVWVKKLALVAQS